MELLTFAELRTKLKRSRSACYVDIAAGRLPRPMKIGSKLYWPSDVVEEYLRKAYAEAAA